VSELQTGLLVGVVLGAALVLFMDWAVPVYIYLMSRTKFIDNKDGT
jgi:hypothetical protein